MIHKLITDTIEEVLRHHNETHPAFEVEQRLAPSGGGISFSDTCQVYLTTVAPLYRGQYIYQTLVLPYHEIHRWKHTHDIVGYVSNETRKALREMKDYCRNGPEHLREREVVQELDPIYGLNHTCEACNGRFNPGNEAVDRPYRRQVCLHCYNKGYRPTGGRNPHYYGRASIGPDMPKHTDQEAIEREQKRVLRKRQEAITIPGEFKEQLDRARKYLAENLNDYYYVHNLPEGEKVSVGEPLYYAGDDHMGGQVETQKAVDVDYGPAPGLRARIARVARNCARWTAKQARRQFRWWRAALPMYTLHLLGHDKDFPLPECRFCRRRM